MGWIGSTSQMLYALGIFGADRDEEGRFKVAGSISSFLGMGEETLVGDDAVFFVDGKPSNLAVALGTTSYGVKNVHVIG
jgi:hypothetical protein